MDTSKQKPDLMGTSRPSADGAKRILAHLEHGAKLPASKSARMVGWSIDGWTIGLGMLLLTMCCAAWFMRDDGARPSRYRHSFSSSSNSSASTDDGRLGKTTVGLAKSETPGASPAAPLEQPAAIVNAIVNDPMLHVEARLEEHQGATARAVHGGLVATSSALPAPRANTPALGPASVTGATVRGATAGDVHLYPGFAKHSAATATARAPAAMHTSARVSSASANDTDVTLLTALVAHAGQPTITAPERSRDIVERHDGDSTAQLLIRCKELGVIEGMLCRSRICSGRWDSDAGCRAPAQ